MNNLLQADIFFYVTTIAVALITITLIIVLVVYVIPILRNLRELSENANGESKRLTEDIKHIRLKIKENTIDVADVYHFLKRFFKGFKNIRSNK